MKIIIIPLIIVGIATPQVHSTWYTGDEHCPPPKDDGTYSAPYNPLDYPNEYPTFPSADKKGWSCSYQREDGVIIQYGDSRTPQEKWLSIRNHDNSSGD